MGYISNFGISQENYLKAYYYLVRFINYFDCFAVILILCFGSVIYLSYLRNAKLKFSGRRVMLVSAISAVGAIACVQILYKNPSSSFDIKLITEGLFRFGKTEFVFDFRSFLIIFVAACAGAIIMLDGISLKRVLTIISYLLLSVILKIYLYYFFCNCVSDECGYFLVSFWYCCIVMITVIVFLIIMPDYLSASRLKKRNIFFNSIILIFYIILNCVLILSVKEVPAFSTILVFLSLICVTVIVFVVMCCLIKNVSKQSSYEYKEKRESSAMKSVDSYYKRNEELTKYLHDLPKHLDVIQAMAFQNGEEELASYTRTLTENYYKARTKFTSGNTTLDELLRLKRVDAEKNNAEIIFSGVFPEHIKIKDNDLRTVFSNAIDNALKNCRGAEKQNKIRINSKIIEDSVVVTVLSIRGSRNKFGIFSYGSDFSRLRRRIIESTVRDYDGAMKWEIDDTTWKLIFSMKYK